MYFVLANVRKMMLELAYKLFLMCSSVNQLELNKSWWESIRERNKGLSLTFDRDHDLYLHFCCCLFLCVCLLVCFFIFFSSPEHEVLMVSYCDQSLAVVRALSTFCLKRLLLQNG